MSDSCRTISFSFEAVRGEYLSRTQSATQRAAILSILCKWKYTVSRTYGAYIYIYIDPVAMVTCVYTMILNLIESFHSLARDDKSHIRTWRAECA